MRVIAGKARRLALKTVPGMETRPTTDRIKETLLIFCSLKYRTAAFLICSAAAVVLESKL